MIRTTTKTRLGVVALVLAVLAPGLAACGSDGLVIYSGRNEHLVGDLLGKLESELGTEIEVRYGGSAEMAAQILEEGDGTDADLFYSQDAGALGALTSEGRLATLPQDVLDKVDERFQAADGSWIGTSARARVVAYDPNQVSEDELPQNLDDLVDPKWEGQVGYPPSNGSWQAFVTAVRVLKGEEGAQEWLEKFQANNPQRYENNVVIRDAVDSGEIALGLINHYYWFRKVEEEGADNVTVKLHYVGGDDPLGLINVAGVGIVEGSDKADLARRAVEYLLSAEAQQFFADDTAEYPVVDGVRSSKHDLPPLSSLSSPDIDLTDLASLEETLKLLQEVGLS